jgi:GMC oxidoreductase
MPAGTACGAANTAKLLLMSANHRHPNGLANGSDSGRPQLHVPQQSGRSRPVTRREPDDLPEDARLQRRSRNMLSTSGCRPKTSQDPRIELQPHKRDAEEAALREAAVHRGSHRNAWGSPAPQHVPARGRPATSVLDVNCKAHELDNLYVVDTSVFPSIGLVNPALTTMANSLRVGDHPARPSRCRNAGSTRARKLSLQLVRPAIPLASGGPGLCASIRLWNRFHALPPSLA